MSEDPTAEEAKSEVPAQPKECKHRWWGFGESDFYTCLNCGAESND